MHKHLFFIFLFLFSFAFAEPEDKANTTVPKSEQTAAEPDKQAAATINTPDTFDPTETLSQDVPTAFPVDI